MIQEQKIFIPKKIEIFDKGKNCKLQFFKGDNCKYISEMFLPEKTFEQSTSYGVSHEIQEDKKLRTEIANLKRKLDGLKKIRTTVEDYNDLIKDIRELQKKIGEDSNNLEINGPINNNEQMKNFEKDIEYIQKKKNISNSNYINDYLDDLDGRIKNEKDDNNYNSNSVQLFTKNIPQIITLFEKVSSELEVRKSNYSEIKRKNDEKIKKKNETQKKNSEYVQLFDEVIEDIEKKIKHLVDVETLKEAKNIQEKCFNEFQNFNKNTLDEITVSNLDIQKAVNISLEDFVQISSGNLIKLTEKIKNLEIHSSSNSLGRNVLDILNKDIILAHQNNHLLFFILEKLANPVYFKTLEKAIIIPNFENFNDKKKEFDKYKNIENE